MNKQTVIIASIINRLFLVLMIGLFLLMKEASRTDFDYIPLTFYIVLFIPFLFIVILTWYQYCNPVFVQKKSVLRIISLGILVIIIAFQSIACYAVVTTWLLSNMLLVPLFIFFLASVYTLVGVYRNMI
jgi:hypothetical protein